MNAQRAVPTGAGCMEPPVFQDVHFGAVAFSSDAESKRQMVTEMEQTSEIEVACCGSQTLSLAVAEVCVLRFAWGTVHET